MSDNTAIAAVTATLKYVLDNGLADASRNKSGIRKVTTLAPGLLRGDDEIGLNLFLYRVAENPNLRNMKLPDRHRPGVVVTSPLALDLFYLLTAHGKLDFESELLLGCAVQIMHENQVLTRETIRLALHTSSPPTEPLWFSSSNLSEQVERIRVVPKAVGTEEMFWLWSAFQAGYRLSMAYQASVVLIDGAQPAAAPSVIFHIAPTDDNAASSPKTG